MMIRMLGAAVAALVLSTAGSASAAVLYQASGTLGSGPEYSVGAGGTMNEAPLVRWTPLTIEINYSTNAQAPDIEGWIEYRAHHQWIGGGVDFSENWIPFALDGSTAFRDIFSVLAEPGRIVATITPEADICPGWDGSYSCHWFEISAVSLIMIPRPGETLTYDITISDYIGSAVPEPATWLMLIAGFGLAGSALRRRQAAMAWKMPS